MENAAQPRRCLVHSLTSAPQYNSMEGMVTGVLANSHLTVLLD